MLPVPSTTTGPCKPPVLHSILRRSRDAVPSAGVRCVLTACTIPERAIPNGTTNTQDKYRWPHYTLSHEQWTLHPTTAYYWVMDLIMSKNPEPRLLGLAPDDWGFALCTQLLGFRKATGLSFDYILVFHPDMEVLHIPKQIGPTHFKATCTMCHIRLKSRPQNLSMVWPSWEIHVSNTKWTWLLRYGE